MFQISFHVANCPQITYGKNRFFQSLSLITIKCKDMSNDLLQFVLILISEFMWWLNLIRRLTTQLLSPFLLMASTWILDIHGVTAQWEFKMRAEHSVSHLPLFIYVMYCFCQETFYKHLFSSMKWRSSRLLLGKKVSRAPSVAAISDLANFQCNRLEAFSIFQLLKIYGIRNCLQSTFG